MDPGKWTGWARFLEGTLSSCGLVSGDLDGLLVEGDALIVEVPQVYRARRQKGSQKGLIDVARIAGRVEERARAANPAVEVTRVLPARWKGQVPKDIHNGRVVRALSSEEWRAARAGLEGFAASKLHNVIDAIGLGLWAVGRGV